MSDPDPLDELAGSFPRWEITYFRGLFRARRRKTSPVAYLRAPSTEMLTKAILEWERAWHARETYGSRAAAMAAAERITNGNQET